MVDKGVISNGLKDSLFENFQGNVSFLDSCIILLLCFVIGIYIYLVYKTFTKTAFYSKDLNVTLAGVTVVVGAIMVAMQSNLVVSLGMVGALSIVRFRTAVKNPLDLLYLFWAISAGIICGVELYALAFTLSFFITILIFVLNKFPNTKAPTLVILNMNMDCDMESVNSVLKNNCKIIKENSVIVKNGEKEIIFSVVANNVDMLARQLNAINGINSTNILNHSGEMRV